MGINRTQSHNLLELLLKYSIPCQNEASHRLCHPFGWSHVQFTLPDVQEE